MQEDLNSIIAGFFCVMAKKRFVRVSCWLVALALLSFSVAGFPFAYELIEENQLVRNEGNVDTPVCTNGFGSVTCQFCSVRGDCPRAGQDGCADHDFGDTFLEFDYNWPLPTPGRITVISGEFVDCWLNDKRIFHFSTPDNCGAVMSFLIPANAFLQGRNVLKCGIQGTTKVGKREKDSGFKLSEFSYRLSSTNLTGSVKVQEGEKPIGVISDLIEPSSLVDTPGWGVRVNSLTPGVLVGIGTVDAKTSNDPNAIVVACADTDNDKKCDYLQAKACLDSGGDWYKGKCCKTQMTTCDYDPGVNALCGKTAEGVWEWVPLDKPGEIHQLLDCPGGGVVSDGKAFLSCGWSPTPTTPQLSRSGLVTSFGEFRNIQVGGFAHEYYCSAKEIKECAGSGVPFSSVNAEPVGGKIMVGGAAGCPSGMIAYWKLDGNANDDVFGNSGTEVGGTYAAGKIGSGIMLDGVDDRVEIANAAVLNPSSQLSIEAWVKPTRTSGRNAIVNKGNAYELFIDNGVLKAGLKIAGTPTWNVFGTQNIPANEWSHVALVFDGNRATIHLNGQQAGALSLSGSLDSTPLGLFIGDKADAITLPSAPFEGIIDEVAFYDKALSQETITSHYGEAEPYCPPGVSGKTVYCASDADWTEDLDAKDATSCTAAGLTHTGSKCCGEADDASEYYNEKAGNVNVSRFIAESSKAVIEGNSIILRENGSFVRVQGPASFYLEEYSERPLTPGVFEKCSTLKGPETKTLNFGQTFIALNREPLTDPSGLGCEGHVVNLSFETPVVIGGCWNKQPVRSGEFAIPDKVINYNGSFYGCKLTDNVLLQLQDTHSKQVLIDNSVRDCGYVLMDARPGQDLPHAVCRPNGRWEFTNEPGGPYNKSIAWEELFEGALEVATTGCCAFDQCWNGSRCQPLNSLYKIGDAGFLCTLEGVTLAQQQQVLPAGAEQQNQTQPQVTSQQPQQPQQPQQGTITIITPVS